MKSFVIIAKVWLYMHKVIYKIDQTKFFNDWLVYIGRLSTLDAYDEPGSIKSQPPRTPAHSDAGDSITDPSSVPVSEIMSPPSVPSKAKKR